jgi:prevent-host-death family protein
VFYRLQGMPIVCSTQVILVLDEGSHRCPLMTSGHSHVRSTAWRFLVMFLTMPTMPLADVKARLFELVGRVQAHHERVTVTVHGRPSAVLIAVEDLEALQETHSATSATGGSAHHSPRQLPDHLPDRQQGEDGHGRRG